MNSFEAVMFIWWSGKDTGLDLPTLVDNVVGKGGFTTRESQTLQSAAKIFGDVYSPELDDRIAEVAEKYGRSREARRFTSLLSTTGRRSGRAVPRRAKSKASCASR